MKWNIEPAHRDGPSGPFPLRFSGKLAQVGKSQMCVLKKEKEENEREEGRRKER